MTSTPSITLSRWERKERLGQGALRRIAGALGIHESLVSKVLHTETTRKRHAAIEQAIATEIGLPVEQVFPPRQSVAA